jgi:diguanylate cyclase (GGDEF)-like protein
MTSAGFDLPGAGTILIIEDDEGLADLIQSSLEEHGFRCALAPTGREAMLRLSDAPPDLMLLDYSLPDMTGMELVTTLLEGTQCVPPYIMITGREDTRLAVSIMQHGARDYLVKDVEFLDRLPAVVSRVKKEADTEKRLMAAEKALRDSEARLAKAQQIARMGSWEWNPANGKLSCSAGICHLLGVSPLKLNAITLDRLSQFVHPADYEKVRRTVEALLGNGKPFDIECRIVCEDQTELVVNGQGEIDLHADGSIRMLSGTLLDITERKRAQSEIQQLAYYDTLTGLPNRTLCQDRLKQAIAQAHREKRLVGVLILDLDRFKSVNDTLGHLYGDRVLKLVAERLSGLVRVSDTVARLGGDEFAIILNAVNQAQDVHEIAAKILNELALPMRLDHHEVFTTGSIGVTVYPMDGEDHHILLKNADIAMYKAKELDKNNYQFFSAEMNIQILERLMLEASLRRALARSEFSLVYQPQIEVNTGRIIGMEVLIRWLHPDIGMIQPDTFISIAEETGLILPIGEWVLRTACARNKAWQDAGFVKLRVAVNVSARQFKQKNLVEMVEAVLAETGMAPEYLELELTESTIMTNALEAADTLRRLKKMGISLSIDDFGTGYSSLSYLKHFSMDRLKIDQSFVHEISTNPDDAAIAEAIIAMGHSLNLKVIAEGVELKGQLEFLRSRNCDEIQGYLLSRPLSEEAFTEILRAESMAN